MHCSTAAVITVNNKPFLIALLEVKSPLIHFLVENVLI